MSVRHRITAREADRIAHLLETIPLPRVRELTDRSWETLLRIAKARFNDG